AEVRLGVVDRGEVALTRRILRVGERGVVRIVHDAVASVDRRHRRGRLDEAPRAAVVEAASGREALLHVLGQRPRNVPGPVLSLVLEHVVRGHLIALRVVDLVDTGTILRAYGGDAGGSNAGNHDPARTVVHAGVCAVGGREVRVDVHGRVYVAAV